MHIYTYIGCLFGFFHFSQSSKGYPNNIKLQFQTLTPKTVSWEPRTLGFSWLIRSAMRRWQYVLPTICEIRVSDGKPGILDDYLHPITQNETFVQYNLECFVYTFIFENFDHTLETSR